MKKIFLLFITGFFFCLHTYAQEDATLAQQYMQSGDYDKAADIYKKLFNDNPNGNYKNYYTCLLALNDYSGIKKIIDKQKKNNPDVLTYYVDAGYAYEKEGNNKLSDEQFNAAINKIKDQKPQVIQLANAFLALDQIDYAVAVYEKAKTIVTGYSFNYELAGLYYQKGELEKSISTYLDYYVEGSENSFTRTTTAFQKILNEQKDHDLLQSLLLERIQKNQNEILFTELLIWDYLELKDFDSAFLQAKALDKRYKENGERIFELAETAQNEGAFDAAILCYDYIILKGPVSPYYFSAKNGKLNCRKQKIFNTNNYSIQDVTDLKNNYLEFLHEYNMQDDRAADVTDDLSKLEAFYIHDVAVAIELLDSVVQWPLLSVANKSKYKLDLGDYYLISGDVWEATLLYSQVDKAMKDEPLGEEARFKNAKLAYYRGEFEYAQGFLDVLKAATSELVANDAMKLSVFITENLGLDSVAEPMQLFAQADLLVFQNKIPEALIVLDTLTNRYPAHALTDDILFLKATIALKNKEINKAVEYLEGIRRNYAFDLLADDAIFKLGEIYQYDLKDLEKAKLCYEQIILNYKDSLYVNEARKRFRELRGDNVNQ